MRERREEPLILVVHPDYRCGAYSRMSLRTSISASFCAATEPPLRSIRSGGSVMFNLRSLDLNLLTVFEAMQPAEKPYRK